MDDDAFARTRAEDGKFDARDRVNVLILYDRPEAGRGAMSLLRKVNDRFVEDLDLQVRLRRLEAVMHPAAAMGDMATPDLLVLALDDGGSLNANVHERLQEVVHQMRGKDAAVAVLTNNDAATIPSQFDFLHQAAEEAGVGFLFPSANRLLAETAPAFTAMRYRAARLTPISEGILKNLPSRPR